MKADKILASALSLALGIYTASAPAVSHVMTVTAASPDFNYEALYGFNEKNADEYSLGDVNNDGAVNSNDASLILSKYSSSATGGKNTFSEQEKIAADVDWNDRIDSSDASYILRYYAYISTQKKSVSMEEYMKSLLNIKDIVTTTTTTNTTATTLVSTTTKPTTTTATSTTTKPTTTTVISTTAKPVTTTATSTTAKPATTTSTSTTTEPTATTSTSTTTEPTTTTELITTTEPETTTMPHISEIIPGLRTINCTEGYEDTLRIDILPEDTKETEVEWESSDENIVFVSDDGQITAKNAGSCIITVTSKSNPDIKAEITINVSAAATETTSTQKDIVTDDVVTAADPTYVQEVKLDHDEMEIAVGYLDVSYISFVPSTAIEKGLIWTSSDEDIATVDDQGWITAKKAGICSVTVQSVSNPNATASVTVRVTDPYAPAPESIELSHRMIYFDIPGETSTVTANIAPDSVADKRIIWTSSDENIATVDENGNITSVGKGKCTIIAKAASNDAVTAEITVEVLEDEKIGVESIDLSRHIVHLEYIGQQYIVSANLLPENAFNKKINWVSSNSKVASVDQNGTITAQSAGTCIITAVSDDNPNVRSTVSIEVSDNEIIPAEKITVSETELKFNSVNDTKQLSAEISPENSTQKNIIWQSSDETIAAVDTNGLVTAKGSGSCKIIAVNEDNSNISAEVSVTVTDGNEDNKVKEITLTEKSLNLVAGGESKQVYAVITPSTASNQEAIWQTSDSGIAAVSENGLITPMGAGTCTITVTSKDNPDVKASLTVNVTAENSTSSVITGITLSKTTMNLTVGQKDISWVTMTPTTAPESLKGEIWTSSNTAVATVDGYGNVTAVGVGTCTITVTSSNNRNVSAKITVNVTGNTSSQITGITLSKYAMNLTVGQRDISWVTMTPTTAPETAKGEIWTSSNTAVATVDGYGNVTAVGIGTCTITVTSSNNRNVSANITVNVTGNSTSSVITGITLSKTTMNLTVGQRDISWVTMTPTTAPESLKGEIWTSSNTAVAIVDGYGNVTAVGAGTCTITVTSSNNRNVSAKITVNVSR